jgi:FeS assembly SUF system protein
MNQDAPVPPEFMPGPDVASDFKAAAGEPLPVGTPPATQDAVVAALRTVFDPEIPVNIYDLGLIYKLAVGATGDVDVEMTLTAPACPVAGEMPGQVANAVAAVAGVGKVSVTLVWEPGWTPERMSEDARLALGMI